jgi:hypothetical protein
MQFRDDILRFPERSRGPASVEAALRAPHLRTKSVDTGVCTLAYYFIYPRGRQIFTSTNRGSAPSRIAVG